MFPRNWFRSPSRKGQKTTTRHPSVRLAVLKLEGRDAPAADFVNAVAFGNEIGTHVADVAADSAGNSYITGNFLGTVDFDPANSQPNDADVLTSAGRMDIFVAKYAANGAFVWAKRMGTASDDRGIVDSGKSIEVDAAGNIYVTGQFGHTAEFGSISLTAATGGKDGFVAKMNSVGTVLWANRWGLPETSDVFGDSGMGIDTDAAGNVYVVGSRQPDGHGFGCDVLKYDARGVQQWAKFIPTNWQGVVTCDLAADSTGNIYVSSSFKGVVDFDPNQGSKLVSSGVSSAGFVLKLTSAGKFSWVTPFVSQTQSINGTVTSGYSSTQSITLDSAGSVIVGGYYSGKVDFDPGNGTTNLPTTGGGFVTKANSNGGLIWAKVLETNNPIYLPRVYGLATDVAGNIYATGYFNGTVDFDPSAATATRTGVYDVFVLKLTSAGSFGWVETFGGSGDDNGWGIAIDPTGTVHFAGEFSGTVDFDPDPVDAEYLTAWGTKRSGYLVRLR